MPERLLKSGITVKTRAVPTHAMAQVGAQFQRPIPPKVPVKSVAGHTEMVTAPTDSPEWLAYVQASNEYDAKVAKAQADFTYDYAVEAWQNGTGEWQTEPPADWEFPAIFLQHGLKPGASRRADYVRYHLLLFNEDISAVTADAIGEAASITDQEVNAALGGFRGNAKQGANTRRKSKRH